jgi:hypothetical protein
MNYCNRVQGFINYALSNLRYISGGSIRYSCKRCKNKKFIDEDVVMMHLLQKRFMEKYTCWYANEKSYVPHDIMIKRMVESTSSANKVHGVVDDNSNPYRNIIMNAMNLNLLFSKYIT